MKNTYGSALALTIFGESHGAAIGAVLDGMAAGVPVDEARVAACMDKRRARGDGLSTARVEADQGQFLSGAPATPIIRPTPNTTAFRTPGAADTSPAASPPRWWRAVPSCWTP